MRLSPKTRTALSWCLAGVMLGASSVQMATSRQRMQLLEERHLWQNRANHWQTEWAQLHEEVVRANRLAERRLLVQSINVSVLRSPVPAEEVRTALDPLTSVLLGMPLAGAKVQVLYEMFDRRVLMIDGKLYRIHVAALLLAAESQLLVQVTAMRSQAS